MDGGRRGDYVHASGAYASDLTDRESALMRRCFRHLGQGATADDLPATGGERDLLPAAAGCQWRMLPREFPPRSTVYGYFRAWIAAGVWAHVHDVLYRRTRTWRGREERPDRGDHRQPKRQEPAPKSREMIGYDAGKRMKGRKRHLVTDTLGLMLRIEVHSAEYRIATARRWSSTGSPSASLPRAHLRRRRLPGARVAAARRARRDRQAHRCQLVRPAQAIGHRAHLAWACIDRRLARESERTARASEAPSRSP